MRTPTLSGQASFKASWISAILVAVCGLPSFAPFPSGPFPLFTTYPLGFLGLTAFFGKLPFRLGLTFLFIPGVLGFSFLFMPGVLGFSFLFMPGVLGFAFLTLPVSAIRLLTAHDSGPVSPRHPLS